MSVVVSCSCGRQFQADPQLYGRQVNCPGCGGMIQVPAGAGTPGLQPIPTPDLYSQPPAKPVAPANEYPANAFAAPPQSANYQYKRRSNFPIVLLVVLGVVGLFGVTLVGGVMYVAYRTVASVQSVLDGTSLELQDEDFATAFRNFESNLLTEGPAPQDWDPLSAPSGAEQITYNSQRDNLELTAFIDPAPGDGKKHPVVIFLHGGFAWGESDWTMGAPFRSSGYIVMTPVLRGENGQAGAFSLYHHEVSDVLGAIERLKQLSYVDTSRIYITGHSAGGSLATLVAMISEDVRAATSLCGCMDQTLNADMAPYPTGDTQEVAIRSPVAYATSFKCAVRLIYGDSEFLLMGGNEATATRAQTKGLDVEAISVPGDHFSAVSDAIAETLLFFASHGGPSSNLPARTNSPLAGSGFTNPDLQAPTYTPPTYTPPTYTPPKFEPPTYTPPTYTPPSFEPPSFEPPTFTPPTLPSRVGPSRVGPSRVGPSRVGPSRVGPSRVSPSRGRPYTPSYPY